MITGADLRLSLIIQSDCQMRKTAKVWRLGMGGLRPWLTVKPVGVL
jgi:hypothetical protein